MDKNFKAIVEKLDCIKKVKNYKKGDILFLDKEKIQFIYIVISGKVSLYKESDKGDKKVIFILEEGEIVNEEILTNENVSVSCETIENTSVYCISREEFIRSMNENYDLCKLIIGSSNLKLRRTYRQLLNTSNSVRLEKRIVSKLCKLSRDSRENNNERIYIKLSITYLAYMIGAKRESVSRELSKLSKKELIIIKNGKIIVENRKNLIEYFHTL